MPNPFWHIFCIQSLNGSKKFFYSDICINDNDFFILTRKKCPEISSKKGGREPSVQSWGGGKRGGQILPKILVGVYRKCHNVPKYDLKCQKEFNVF